MERTNILRSTFSFLSDLSEHNERDWFNENKHRYLEAHKHVIEFADSLLDALKQHDEISTISGKKSLMRIYRDVRFSKDKSPYKARFAGSFVRVKPQLRGGYFFSFKPGETIIGGGFYNPDPKDLKLIRDHLAQDDSPLRKVINSASFKKHFGELEGDRVKTAPKGFDKEHPSIDLLKYKSMYTFRSFSDAEVHDPAFLESALDTFLAIRPFFDVMTDFLTTDLNGISLLDE